MPYTIYLLPELKERAKGVFSGALVVVEYLSHLVPPVNETGFYKERRKKVSLRWIAAVCVWGCWIEKGTRFFSLLLLLPKGDVANWLIVFFSLSSRVRYSNCCLLGC